jgi:hypothetical protein
MYSLAVVMFKLMFNELRNTDVGSCFSFCYIIVIVADNFKFFRTYVSSLHLESSTGSVWGLQISLTMHDKPLLPLPELH